MFPFHAPGALAGLTLADLFAEQTALAFEPGPFPAPHMLPPPPPVPAWPGEPPAVDFGPWPALAPQALTPPAFVDPWW